MSKITAYIDIAIEYLFYLLIFLVPLVFTTANYELFEFPKMLLTYGFTVVIFALWLIKQLYQGKITILKSIISLALILFFLSQLLSTIFSIDVHTSIFGYYSRFHGGLLSTIAYIILFFVLVSSFNRQKVEQLLYLIVATATFISIWGTLSHFNLDPSCRIITGVWTSACWSQNFDPTLRIFATLGQPNWLAAYLAMILPVALASVVIYKKIIVKISYSISSIIIFWAFILTNSRAATLGLGLGLIIFVIMAVYLFFKSEKSEKKLLFASIPYVITITILFIAIVFIWGQTLIGRVREAQQTISPPTISTDQPSTSPGQTALQVGGTESGKIRFIVWQGALDIFKNYPLLGSGVETFGYTYYNFRPIAHNLTTEWDFLYNKAHNEYLNFLSTTGIIGFSSYMFLIFTFLFYALKKIVKITNLNSKLMILGLVSGYITFLIQNFFGFSVVAIATLFFIYYALIIIISQVDQNKIDFYNLRSPRIISASKFSKIILSLFIILISIYLLLLIYRYFNADKQFANAQSFEASDSNEQALITFQQAIKISPTAEPLYLANLALVSAELAADKKEDSQFIELATNSIDKALQISPANLNLRRLSTRTYLTLAQIDPTYLLDALKSAQIAAKLAPTEPEIQYQLAMVYNTLGEKESAKDILDATLKLKPDFVKAKEALDMMTND